jgi:L-malate glycosyltransferase
MAPPDAAATRWRTRIYRGLVRSVLLVYIGVLRIAGRRRRRSDQPANGLHILLTGTFQSDNWIRAHLGPLAAAGRCQRLTMVASSPLPALPKVQCVMPPALLVRLAGNVPARLLTFAAVAIRDRPDVVGGFHLLVNGLAAILIGRLLGARSWYFSVGGPVELLDGGVWGENPHFARLETPDPVVEGRLIEAAGSADLVITMGSGARDFLRGRGVTTNIEVVPGGIVPPGESGGAPAEFDLILVARLVPIKQIDRFVRLVRYVTDRRPQTTAVIVGDGPLRPSLESLTSELGLTNVRFAGFQPDVTAWLRRARVFVLTSRSEGVALSLMEAMTCGLPAVVPRVGDLADLVVDGVNGFAVEEPTPERMGECVLDLLEGPAGWTRFAAAARESAAGYSVAATTGRWNTIFGPGPPALSRSDLRSSSQNGVSAGRP